MSDDSKKNPLFIPTAPAPQPFPDRNPTVVLDRAAQKRCCPKCGSENFNGRKVQGTVTFTCSNKDCRNQWAGGMGVPLDPRIPLPPPPRPPLDFDRGIAGEEKGQIVEVRRAVDLRPDYRKGALIPKDEE